MGRNTSGVKGINLTGDDELVGMVVADPDGTLLTVCQKGYGKRTPFGANAIEDGPEDESSSSAKYRTQNRGGKGIQIRLISIGIMVVMVVRIQKSRA